MELHNLQPIHIKKEKKRVGRGGKRGTFSGKGVKGQKSRAGRKMQPFIREVTKRYPKLKGYRQILLPNKEASLGLDALEKNFQTGEIVTPKILVEKKLVRRLRGRAPMVKILAKGQITKKLVFRNCDFSEKAKEAVEKVGGIIK